MRRVASIRRMAQEAVLRPMMIVMGTRAAKTKKNDYEDNEGVGMEQRLPRNNNYKDDEGTRMIDREDGERTGAGGREQQQYFESEMEM